MASSERRRRATARSGREANAEYTDANADDDWAHDEISLGHLGRSPSPSSNVLGDVARPRRRRARLRHRVLLGVARQARRAARRRRHHARRSSRRRGACRRETGLEFPLVEADAGGDRRCRTRRSTSSSPSTARRSGSTRTAGSPRRRGCSGPGGRLVFLRNSTLVDPLLAPTRSRRRSTCSARSSACAASSGRRGRRRVPPAARRVDRPAARERLRGRARCIELQAPDDARDARVLRLRDAPTGRGSGRPRRSGRAEASDERSRPRRRSARVDLAAAARDPRAARHPVRGRRAALRGASPGTDAASSARARQGALGATAGERPVLGVDTRCCSTASCSASPRTQAEAERCSSALAGRTHEVVSGLCLRTPAWEELHERDDRA